MLIRKTLRDIGKNKVQFMAVFLMLFFGCFLFSGITGEWNGLQRHFDSYIEKQNMADAWVFSKGFTESEIHAVKEEPKVKQAESRMAVTMNLSGESDCVLDCYFTEENNISELYILKGIPFNREKKGMWLDASFARENKINLGDTVRLRYQGMEAEGPVLGLVYSPEYIYGAEEGEMMPDYKKHGFAFLSPLLLPSKEMFSPNQIVVKTEETAGNNLVKDILGRQDIRVIKAEEHPSMAMIRDEISQHKAIGTAFSSVFLLIAVMIVITTMHRMLRNQRNQIGIMKALGFTNARLMLHYLSHSSLIALCGALAGSISGTLLMPDLLYTFIKKLYVIPQWGGYLPAKYFMIILLCVLLCIGITFVICRKYLSGNAAGILSGMKEEKHMVSLPKACDFLPFASRWNLRDVERNRLRSVMTLFGILGCTALLFSAFALYDTFMNLSQWTFTKQQTYQCKITDLPDESGQKELLSRTDGEYLMEASGVILEGKKEKNISITVPESSRYLKLADSLESFVETGDGIALSKTLADRLGIEKGDTLKWRMSGEKELRKSPVEAIIRTPLSQGIVMNRDAFEKAGGDFYPTAIIGKTPENGFGKYKETCTIAMQKDLAEGVDGMMEGMMMMITFLVAGAAVLGGVMLYNLGILSYLERYREFATLKVLGFADRKIRKIMIQQNVWLCIAGIVLGIPTGYGLLLYMLSTIPDSMDVIIYVKAISWLLSAAGTLLLSWLISRVVSRKIPHINMVEALKARE